MAVAQSADGDLAPAELLLIQERPKTIEDDQGRTRTRPYVGLRGHDIVVVEVLNLGHGSIVGGRALRDLSFGWK
jgi:hypothetical protein